MSRACLRVWSHFRKAHGKAQAAGQSADSHVLPWETWGRGRDPPFPFPQLLLPRALFESVHNLSGDAEASEGNGAMSLH